MVTTRPNQQQRSTVAKLEGEPQVYQVRVCSEEEARRPAAKANGELGLSDAEIDRLIEQSLPK